MSALANCRWRPVGLCVVLGLSLAGFGCRLLPPGVAQPTPQGRAETDGPVAVETATAKTGTVTDLVTYTGTTQPVQQVTVRSQISGRITTLTVDVGDPVVRGATLAELDGSLQTTDVNEARAELSARQAETAQAEVAIREAETAVVQAQATLDQATIDLARQQRLAREGAVSEQVVEAAELAVTNAQQAVRAAQAQVAAQQQAAASAADRIDAQQAVLAQTQQQLTYAALLAPLTGVVLARPAEMGDVVESGAAVLEVGDLSTIKVTVQVSELEIAQLSRGQPAQVRLDAFPDADPISGRIERISPVADAASRLIEVQVTLPNPEGRIGSGLLARVQFPTGAESQVVVPLTAMSVGQENETLFVIEGEGEDAQAIARPVRTGTRTQEQVEILSGLDPGESFVVKSARPLTTGQAVRLSILSE